MAKLQNRGNKIIIIILYINSLRLSVMELGSVRPIGLDPALPAGQSPAVGGVGPGSSQKADRARLGTPHGCDGARRNSCTDRSSPARHSWLVSRPPWGCRVESVTEGRPSPARHPHSCDGARRKKVVCVWRGKATVTRAKASWVSSVSYLLCSRGQKLLGTRNDEQHKPLGRKRI
jgi:hypothetical protein